MQEEHPTRVQRKAAPISSSDFVIVLKASILISAVLILYWQDLSIIFNDAFLNEATSYILAIPPLLCYFVYRKRKMIRAVIPSQTANTAPDARTRIAIVGILTCATAVTLYWYGSYTFTPLEYHAISLPIFTAGLVLIMFNAQTLRQSLFPICFLIFLIPPPTEILYSIGSALSAFGSETSSAIVNAFGVPAKITTEYGNPTITITRPDLSTTDFMLDIACSGVYLLLGFLLFACLTAYIIRDKAWKKAGIFFLGLPLIYILNIARIVIILLIGYNYGEQLALQVFHLLGGLALLAVGTLLLLVISDKLFKTHLFKRIQSKPCSRCETSESNDANYCPNCGRLYAYPEIELRKSDLIKIAAVAISVTLLISIQAPAFALTETAAQIFIETPTGQIGNTRILPEIQGYNLSFSYRDSYFEQQAGQDAALLYSYIPADQNRGKVWVELEISPTRSSLHRWEVCLVISPQAYGYRQEVIQLDLRDVEILQNPPVIARYFSFQYKSVSVTQVVLYWYETATFIVNSNVRREHIKISVITIVEQPQGMAEAEESMLPFATAIAEYWQPIETWSQVTLLLSRNGSTLTMASMILIGIIIVFDNIVENRNKKEKTKAYKKLSRGEQQIIDAVQHAERDSDPVFENIAKEYQRAFGKLDEGELNEKLVRAKKAGLISSYIVNQHDQPIQVWRTNLARDYSSRRFA